jgi:protein LTV1
MDVEHPSAAYSNLENHPQVIRARVSKHQPLPRDSLNTREGSATKSQKVDNGTVDMCMSSESDSKSTSALRGTVTRPRHETKEDKKVRKQAVKTERQARRKEKKITKELFLTETSHQMKATVNMKTKTLRL